jgi:hypothetical protein
MKLRAICSEFDAPPGDTGALDELLKAGYMTNAAFVVTNLAVTGPQITNRLNRAFTPGKRPASVNLLTEQNRVEVICRTRDLPLVTKAVLENQE